MPTADDYLYLQAHAPWFLPLLIGVLGACVGSFLNVVIYRLPAGRSIVRPASACACGLPIAWHDNIPILSWFLLGGRCRGCRATFSFRYPLVEALTAAVFVGLWLNHPPLVALSLLPFAGCLIAAAFIDWDTLEIPDVFSVGGFGLGLVAAAMVPALHGYASELWVADALRAVTAALLGAFVSSALLMWIAVVGELALRREAMGFGDVKLMGAIGAFCGWQGGVFTIFAGAFLGAGATLLYYALRSVTGGVVRETAPTPAPPAPHQDAEPDPFKPRALHEDEDTGADTPQASREIPFGPALGAAALLYLLLLEPYVDRYFALLRETLY